MDLGKLTALQLAEKIKQHQISVLDGVKYVFDQIEAKRTRSTLILILTKEAYARAKEVQKGIEDGTYTGPLAGVPIAIKDNICIKGKQLPVHQRSLRILCRSTMPRLLTVWNRQVL